LPSRLGTLRPRPGQRQPILSALAAELHEETMRGPWPGYIPDVEPGMLPYSAMVGTSFGLVARGEVLVPDIGWSRVDPTNLPLGDDGAGVGDLAATAPQNINHLGFFNRQPTSPTEIIAITEDEARAGSEISHVFRLPSTVTWSVVPPRNGYAAPTFTPWSLSADSFVDDATMPIGFNINRTGHYAAAAGRGIVGQPIYFFVNETNPVACWPCYRGGVVTEYDYPIEAIGTLTGFMAATCEAIDGRMCYGNVTYGSTNYPQRMYHSAIGDGAAVGTGVVGAGFIDASEMSGKMLRILRLGDSLVGYFESGIVVYNRTFNSLAPFSLQYITHQVNALSKRSVVLIDRDRHFIIAEQGWFLLDGNGLQELGLLNAPGGVTMRKWQDTFYANVNLQKKEHISLAYDSTHHLVEISFPSVDEDVADTSWLYDTLGDRVFPSAPYGAQAIQSQLVAPSVVDPALTWGGLVGSWGGLVGSWASYAARKGFQSRYHGDRSGYVYVRDESKGFARESTTGVDVQPGYAFVSPQRAVIAPAEWAEARRFEVEYVNVSGPNATLTVKVDARTATGVRSLVGVAAGYAGVAFLPVANTGGTHHSVAVSGTAPVALRGMRYVAVPMKGERKGNL
jgi:hypothetical protein